MHARKHEKNKKSNNASSIIPMMREAQWLFPLGIQHLAACMLKQILYCATSEIYTTVLFSMAYDILITTANVHNH